MKNIALLGVLLLLCAQSKGQNKEDFVDSEIKEVTIFLTGAEIHRTANVTLNAGMTTLVFSEISSKLDKESIQATVTKDVKIVGTMYDRTYYTSEKQDNARIKKVSDSLSILDKKVRELQYQRDTYLAEKKVIESNNVLGQGNNGMSVTELQKLAVFYRTELMDINKRVYDIDNKLKDFNEKTVRYTTELNNAKMKTNSGKYVNEIRVTVQSKAKITTPVTIKYMVGGTGWAPKYDIRVEDVKSNIELGYQAKVINQTGEDWERVKLVLSTAAPAKTQQVPVLKPWLLNYRNRAHNEGLLDKYRPKIINEQQAKKLSGGLDIVQGVQYAEVDVSALGVEFKIKEKYTIPSDSKPYLVDVTDYDLPANYKYSVVPKVDSDAFLIAQITGWEKLNLLEGKTNLYFRGTYIGNSYIKPQYANDTLDISLGRDPKIMVNRAKVEDKFSKKVIGTNKKETFTYKITVRNTNSTKVKLSLLDQIPVSQESDIVVEKIELSGGKLDDLTGALKWNFDLDPGEAKEVTIAFSVKYPKNKNVRIRGNRNIAPTRSKATRFL
jgi:uncharacterized protein (TIGR02231 family)